MVLLSRMWLINVQFELLLLSTVNLLDICRRIYQSMHALLHPPSTCHSSISLGFIINPLWPAPCCKRSLKGAGVRILHGSAVFSVFEIFPKKSTINIISGCLQVALKLLKFPFCSFFLSLVLIREGGDTKWVSSFVQLPTHSLTPLSWLRYTKTGVSWSRISNLQ